MDSFLEGGSSQKGHSTSEMLLEGKNGSGDQIDLVNIRSPNPSLRFIMHVTILMGMKIWGSLVVRKPVKTLFNH